MNSQPSKTLLYGASTKKNQESEFVYTFINNTKNRRCIDIEIEQVENFNG